MNKNRDNSLFVLLILSVIMILLNFGNFIDKQYLEQERLEGTNAEVTQKARSI